MNKSKRTFIIISIVFLIILIVLAIDISSRTTFPGKKHTPSEQVEAEDTTGTDTVKPN